MNPTPTAAEHWELTYVSDMSVKKVLGTQMKSATLSTNFT